MGVRIPMQVAAANVFRHDKVMELDKGERPGDAMFH